MRRHRDRRDCVGRSWARRRQSNSFHTQQGPRILDTLFKRTFFKFFDIKIWPIFYLSGLLSVLRFRSHFDESLCESVSGFEIFEFEEKILSRSERQDQVGWLQLTMGHVSRHFSWSFSVILRNGLILLILFIEIYLRESFSSQFHWKGDNVFFANSDDFLSLSDFSLCFNNGQRNEE